MTPPGDYELGAAHGWSLAPILRGGSAEYLRGYLSGIGDADDECAAAGLYLRGGSQVGKKRRYMLSEARRLLRNVTSDDR